MSILFPNKKKVSQNNPLKRYGYVYDGLNRLKAGFYQKAGTEASKEYFEKIEYDLNGNIKRLKRSEGTLQNGSIALQVDNLKYDYVGNRLTKITDEQENPSGYPYFVNPNDIEYDNNQANGNGNMTKHLDKGISSIQYNYLNLPKQITQNTQVTNYLYRADGVKLKKLFADIETNYLDGFQYKALKPSQENPGGLVGPDDIAVMKLRIIPTSEGYFDAVTNQYIYNYTDHLGNIRLSYTDTNKDGIIQPRQYFVSECSGNWNPPFEFPICIDNWKPGEIVEINNYYPFGLMHNYTTTTQNAYQYKYQGQELQETGMYMFKYRTYMPDTGRFIQLDPLTEKFPYNSTYAIQENKMGMGIELEGLELLKTNSGYFAIKGNQMTVKQAPITQRDSFGRPSFRAGDIGLTTSGYNSNGARITDGATGLKLNSYKYNGATDSEPKMEGLNRDNLPTNVWYKMYIPAADNARKAVGGLKELIKNAKMALDIPEAIKSTNDYVQATKDVNSVLDQAGIMGDAINYVDSSGIKMGPQTRNDVVNFVFDGTLPPGTDTQNGLIIQNGTSILNSNSIPVRPTPEQINQKKIDNL
ncbi:RHS repeat domain-containing protein [Chryseobacterium turcicum]|uniref:RHS repeat-associated core domain-containing protein n=1 Tax=Chryseobacterium turcicum TaxID=2898076 RepID=A0A9Q3YW04_9FLAO|nr:RHS repeat-associated core domain-containing protein [Chryseobacterium turcicum]MCD1117448.1 hypothetical protein [Chryseobacterium turcicum]